MPLPIRMHINYILKRLDCILLRHLMAKVIMHLSRDLSPLQIGPAPRHEIALLFICSEKSSSQGKGGTGMAGVSLRSLWGISMYKFPEL